MAFAWQVEDAAEFTPSDVFELMMYAASFSQYWRGFLSGELEVLCQLVILQRVQRGEQMLVMGEAASFFGLVLSGRVKIYDKRHDLTRCAEMAIQHLVSWRGSGRVRASTVCAMPAQEFDLRVF